MLVHYDLRPMHPTHHGVRLTVMKKSFWRTSSLSTPYSETAFGVLSWMCLT